MAIISKIADKEKPMTDEEQEQIEEENRRINAEADWLEDWRNEEHFKEADEINRQAASDHHFLCLAKTVLAIQKNYPLEGKQNE